MDHPKKPMAYASTGSWKKKKNMYRKLLLILDIIIPQHLHNLYNSNGRIWEVSMDVNRLSLKLKPSSFVLCWIGKQLFLLCLFFFLLNLFEHCVFWIGCTSPLVDRWCTGVVSLSNKIFPSLPCFFLLNLFEHCVFWIGCTSPLVDRWCTGVVSLSNKFFHYLSKK